jgi:hypothetical protein
MRENGAADLVDKKIPRTIRKKTDGFDTPGENLVDVVLIRFPQDCRGQRQGHDIHHILGFFPVALQHWRYPNIFRGCVSGCDTQTVCAAPCIASPKGSRLQSTYFPPLLNRLATHGLVEVMKIRKNFFLRNKGLRDDLTAESWASIPGDPARKSHYLLALINMYGGESCAAIDFLWSSGQPCDRLRQRHSLPG